jgi:hypothetical protein
MDRLEEFQPLTVGDIAQRAGNMVAGRLGVAGDIRNQVAGYFSPETRRRAYTLAGMNPATAVIADAPTSGQIQSIIDALAGRR